MFPRVGNEYTPTATGKPHSKTKNLNIVWCKQIIKLQDRQHQGCSVVIALYYCSSLCEILICAAVSHILTIIPQTPVVRFSCYVQNGGKVQAQNKVSKVQFSADWRADFGQHGAVCLLTWRLGGAEETWWDGDDDRSEVRSSQTQVSPSLCLLRRNMALANLWRTADPVVAVSGRLERSSRAHYLGF